MSLLNLYDWDGIYRRDYSLLYRDLVFPKTNLREDETNIYYSIDLPGLDKENIEIKVRNNILFISAERKNYNSSKLVHKSLTLPSNINLDSHKITYTNGVLNISFMKCGEKTRFLHIE